MDIKKTERISEFDDVFKILKINIHLTKIFLLFFTIMSLFFIFYTRISISPIVPVILFVWLIFYLINEYFLLKTENIQRLYFLYFQSLLVSLFFVTTIIHFLGGVEWIGGMFYILITSLGAVILPKNETRKLIILVFFFYFSLVFLEFFEIIPHRNLLANQEGMGLHLDLIYITITSSFLITFIFFSTDMVSSFAEILREKRDKLIQAQKKAIDAFEKIDEAKKVLEIRVDARTKELKFLTENLESQVRERTDELEKKLKELEKINKLMIGREIKMIDLKDELRKTKKKKIEEYKKESEGLKNNLTQNE